MSLFGVIVVAFYLTVIIRLGTWGECARKGYHSCIVRAYPVFDEKIYQDPLRACACNTLVFVDTRCLTKSNELVNATSTPFASEVLNSSAILNPTVSLFIGTCQADGELLYTIAAHARQLSVLAVSELPNTRQFEAPGNKSRTVGWEIPATFGSMAGEMAAWWPMQSLCFSRLSIGTIPSSIGMLSSLRSIRIDHTDFRGGTIPAFLSEMTNLVELFLNYNRLSGTIPASLGILTCTYGEHALSTLDVSSCRCHHIVVTRCYIDSYYVYKYDVISNLLPLLLCSPLLLSDPDSALHALQLQGNSLSGSIPASLGRLTVAREILLDDNQLVGTIPSSLDGLRSLQQLRLNNNSLQGAVPSSLGRLTTLRYMLLGFNKLTSIPPGLLELNRHRAVYVGLQGNNIPASNVRAALLSGAINRTGTTAPSILVLANNPACTVPDGGAPLPFQVGPWRIKCEPRCLSACPGNFNLSSPKLAGKLGCPDYKTSMIQTCG